MLNVSTHASALEPLADLFKLLSDSTRLRILSILVKGERNVTSLCQELQLPQPTVSHHLGLMRIQNVIINRRNGKQVFYALHSHVTAGDGGCLEVSANGYKLRICGPAETL